MEQVRKVFAEDGLLSRFIRDYEMRPEQMDMSIQVMDAYKRNKVLLIEAATGVGKSWAYLAPALLWAAAQKGPTLIATHTIALQEQLLHKDIPFLLKALSLDMKVTLVKGMGNYFCLKKYEEFRLEKGSVLTGESFSSDEEDLLVQLERFSRKSDEGSLSDIDFPLSPGAWDSLAADRFSCTRTECPHYKNCFFFKARKKMADADVLITNHHLLATDLASRLRPDFEEDHSIFPKFSKVIIDEAHHLEEIALESFSQKIDRLDLQRSLGRIWSDYQPQKSRIGLIKTSLSLLRKQIPPAILTAFDLEIPLQKRNTTEAIDELFAAIEQFCGEELVTEASAEGRGKRWRLPLEKTQVPAWSVIESMMLVAQEEWLKLANLLVSLRKEIQISSTSEKEKESLSSHFQMLDRMVGAVGQKIEQLEMFIRSPEQEYRVRWMESFSSVMNNFILVDATLNVSEHLKKLLFSVKDTSILCSATLTAGQNFSYVKQQIGVGGEEFKEKLEEKIYPSSFNFEKNALFLVPEDAPLPHEPAFVDYTVAAIEKIVATTKGGCFILFTSYELLESCYEKIAKGKKLVGSLQYLKQGEFSRQVLIERFRERKDSVLFATASFWEGIDIAGEALRCVVLVKLPFRVPTEPLFQAMCERLAKEGKDPFSSYSLPQACLKFKQGFGRLIRTQSDRGCVICLDKRVMTKAYGKSFLKSLPTCPIVFKEGKELIRKMAEFYAENSIKNRG